MATPRAVPLTPLLVPTAAPWRTGNARIDTYIDGLQLDFLVLDKIAQFPLDKRKHLCLTCWDRKPQNPGALFSACCRNHETKAMEKRLTH